MFGLNVPWTALYALAWFLLGLLLGRRWGQTPKRASPPAAKPGRRTAGLTEIYVGNIAYDVSDEDLEKAFRRFGQVQSARIITNKSSGESKGYGFVEMPDADEAQAAIKGLNGKGLKGRDIVVNEARSRAGKRKR
jgi:RNA recognition motif-containing protein